MKVKLRTRKLKNNISSLFLELYEGKDSEGKYKRSYKPLELYIFTKPKDITEKNFSQNSLALAKKIVTKEQHNYDLDKNGFNRKNKAKSNFITFFKEMTESKYDSKGNYGSWTSTLKLLIEYAGSDVTFEKIDTQFIEGFKKFLDNYTTRRTGNKLAQNSKVSYFRKLKASLRYAINNNIIDYNPAERVQGIPEEETIREYLDKSEIEMLVKTPLKPEILKKAFLFSCLTGLRFGDIKKLTWSELENFNDEVRIKIRQEKTKNTQYLELHPQAIELINSFEKKSKFIFDGLIYNNEKIKNWVIRAGIDKNITFHCGRHTHATLLMTSGVDLYVIKEILGHKNIHTTQIYTKIVDERRKEAINKLPIFNSIF
ncbi:tyrosine-type recombinase/integrase [Flavobacterium columnare]|uniref:Site-specific integrase n=1 Tax=Flavobacterium columnare TaxID=996 RepID=A0AA94JN46_9FLAO|nr:site-specific integrase [Flavobacterium columnare]MCH4830603.1 site-specific integrase [Flavobacterium columnare]MCH4833460.1 site-specific integrase [Flavobacterium columnare]